MSRVRNADDFLLLFRGIKERYESVFAPLVAKIKGTFAEDPGELPPAVDESVEAHVRAYVVNAMLAALNWGLDKPPERELPNLLPEAPVKGASGTRRFLDYLGIDDGGECALLVVETKRPSSQLPRLTAPPQSGEDVPLGEILVRGLKGEQLSGDWSKWLDDLADYVQSLTRQGGSAPRRVLLTNGDWLIVFRNPNVAFLGEGECRSSDLLICRSRSEIEEHFRDIYLELEHQRVLGETLDLAVGEVPFLFDGTEVDQLAHGLRLRYIEQPNVWGKVGPVVRVAPLVLIRSRWGAWVRVGSEPEDFELPHKTEELAQHLRAVDEAAARLLRDVSIRLNTDRAPLSVRAHYDNEESFAAVHGVADSGANQFILFTGQYRHFLRPEPSVPDCPFHDLRQTQEAGAAPADIVATVRQIHPRSFFVSGELHYCAHRDVAATKAATITAGNRARCGPRSGQEGQAFCEIYRFEVSMCCRTCSFEEACSGASVFHLPCRSQTTRIPDRCVA